MNTKQQRYLISALVLLLVLTGLFVYRTKIKALWFEFKKQSLPQAQEFKNFNTDEVEDETPAVVEKEPTNEPANNNDNQNTNTKPSQPEPTNPSASAINLKVPFTSQAPFSDWSMPFKEACEEASLLMVDYFYRGKTFTQQIAKDEILKMVAWLDEHYDGRVDLTAAETAAVAKDYLGYKKVEVIDNPTIEQIKAHLNQQRPVIVPAAGRDLGNPNFTAPGPIYHMLVIKGYTATKFITNDPGTRNGADYVYTYQTLMDSIHDWNYGAEIRQGAKRVIVVYPN
ncbi:MAG: C39 family peptidase [bacterium]|nr:C39 family peptidase [bacterium]